jgi:hypothetical protein
MDPVFLAYLLMAKWEIVWSALGCLSHSASLYCDRTQWCGYWTPLPPSLLLFLSRWTRLSCRHLQFISVIHSVPLNILFFVTPIFLSPSRVHLLTFFTHIRSHVLPLNRDVILHQFTDTVPEEDGTSWNASYLHSGEDQFESRLWHRSL